MQAVLFDMDGVLCSTIGYHYQSWKKAVEPYGIPFNRADNEKLRGLSRAKSLEVILDGAQLREEEFQAILADKNRWYMEFVENMTPEDLAPGVGELLLELRQAHVKVGVASSSRNVRPILKRLGIEPYVQAVCDGNVSHRSKPDPFPYRYTAAALGLHPSSCMAVEDGSAGVESALAAGVCVLGLGSPDEVGKADAVFPSLVGVHLKDLREIHRAWSAARPPEAGQRRQARCFPRPYPGSTWKRRAAPDR